MERDYYPYVLTTASLIGFFALNYFVFIEVVFSNFEFYNKSSKAIKVEWKSRVVSTIHAIMSLVGAYYCLWGSECGARQVFGFAPVCDLSIIISTSYWIFDVLLVLGNYAIFKDPVIVAHHIACITPFLLGRYFEQGWGYGCRAQLTELSTPFVNNRWFFEVIQRKYPKMSLSNIQVANGILLWLTFVFGRIINLPLMLRGFVTNDDRFFSAHWSVWGTMFLGTVLVTVLSFYWFWKITKGLYKKLSEMASE